MPDGLRLAAEYARMSTEDQKYSIDNQHAVITEYARLHGFEVVRTFRDPGISGLDLKHRPGLKELLETVVGGKAQFSTILVLDVSRWGRFQDIDESAYYEFLCRQAGVQVQYCAEPFVNDHSPYSNLIKAIKRTMAAEYSRELGTKVFRGQARLAALGFKQGGTAQIGLRRLLVDQDGNPKQSLGFGERKSLMTDRVILVPGPKAEVRFVQSIFAAFVEGKKAREIARDLRGKRPFGRRWTDGSVSNLLRNPQYVGTYVYNRTSTKLRAGRIVNPPEQWITKSCALQPIIPFEVFQAAQERLANLTINLTNEQMLVKLTHLWKREGYVTVQSVNLAPDIPSASAYRNRFGSLAAALRLIGFPVRKAEGISKRRMLADLRRELWECLKANLRQNGIRLRKRSYEEYKIHAGSTRLLNFVLAQRIDNAATGPLWCVRVPRPAPIGASVIGIVSSDGKIIEYIITGCLRKTPVKSIMLSIPFLARVALARFSSPEQFADALRTITPER